MFFTPTSPCKRLDRTKHSFAELIPLITQQILQGDYTNWVNLVEIYQSPLFSATHSRDSNLKKAHNAFIKVCMQERPEENMHAIMLRGFLYQSGLLGFIDYTKAIKYYEQAIRFNNNAAAMTNLAVMYQDGQGCLQDLAKAIELYDKAIVLNDSIAMNNRAVMHHEGQGCLQDFAKAIELYDKAITFGNAQAMYMRAFMHLKGQGGPQDFAKAIALYDKAIALRHTGAMANRGYMHQYGQGGPINLLAAILLYEQAIRGGLKNALTQLKTISIDKTLASVLLDSIWDDLARGQDFSDYTLSAINKHCKQAVLRTIQTTHLATSLTFLKELSNPYHPLARIINNMQDHHESAEFKMLMISANTLLRIRCTFFSKQRQIEQTPINQLPIEVRMHIFSFAQPGMKQDSEAHYFLPH